MNGQKQKFVDKFTFSRAVHIDDEATARVAKASVALRRHHANVWKRNGIKLDTKLKVYKAMVLPTLFCACETWIVYRCHAKRLKLFGKAVQQDSRHGGPEESRDASHAYSLKASTAKMDWPCYKNA